MKQIALSIEQMKHLEELGLDTSDASMMYLDDGNENKVLGFKNISFDRNDGDIPAYTLQDMLENHLFKLEFKSEEDFIQFGMDDISMWVEDFQSNVQHEVKYSDVDSSTILAAYNMLCWCIEKGYIKK